MSVELDEEDLPPLDQQTVLWIVEAEAAEHVAAQQATAEIETVEEGRLLDAARAVDILPLLHLPVGSHQEGDWQGDWAAVGQRLQACSEAGTRVAVKLAGISGHPISRLTRSSVRQLLQQAAPRLEQAAAVILDTASAPEGLESGGWQGLPLQAWSEWASVLPDATIPIVAIDLHPLPAAEALHLAISSQSGCLMLALRMPDALEALDGEVPWMGWGAPTSRGALFDGAAPDQGRLRAPEARQPARVGLVFPLDRLRTPEDCEVLLQAWQDCLSRGWGVRLLREEEIHQAWHGLEALVVLGGRISGKGRRQLAGFFAAGGAILWLRQETGMVEERPFAGCQEFQPVE